MKRAYVDRPWRLSRLEKSLFKRFEMSCRLGAFSNYCIENSEVRFKSLFTMWARRTVVREGIILCERQKSQKQQQEPLLSSRARVCSPRVKRKGKVKRKVIKKTALIAAGRIIFNGKGCYPGGDHIAHATLKRAQKAKEKKDGQEK